MSPKTFQPKIALLGSGMIGGTAALLAGLKGITNNIVMLDVVDGMPTGKALDLGQAFSATDVPMNSTGCSDISVDSEGLEGSDVVIVTAGFPRKPGMSRDDLLGKNAEVITGVGKAIKAKCPDAFVICITNPLDVMVGLLQKASGLPPSHVIGMGGMLDTSRFRYFLAEALKVSVHDIQSMVLGGHGDDMVPLKQFTSICGIPLTTMIKMGRISEEEVEKIVQRTRQGGGEIVSLLKMGSAFVAPATCAIEMASAYLRDEKRVMPACCHMTGQYGFNNVYGGVPCIVGKNGVEEILEIPLSDEEKTLFSKSMEAVTGLRTVCQGLGFDC